MLICLGGFLGSGRKILAHKIATKHHFYYFDINALKPHEFATDKAGAVREVLAKQNTDSIRLYTYKRVLAEFPRLSKMYPDMILEDAFHRKGPREYFFAEARKYFDKVVFIWIDSDESHVEPRLRYALTSGAIKSMKQGLKRRGNAAAEFQQLEPHERVFKCVIGDTAEAAALWKLIQLGSSSPKA